MRLWLLSAVLLAGCSGGESDPCFGQPAVCLAVEVTGTAPVLDAIDVAVSGGFGRFTGRAFGSPSDIRLPVKFAALLPSDTVGPLAVEAVGSRVGVPLAYGVASIIVPPSGQRVVVRVASLAADLGVGGPRDLSGINFIPDFANGGGDDFSVTLPDFSNDTPDLAQPFTCQPTSCTAMSAFCGTPSDGCGGTLVCGGPCVLANFATVAAQTLSPARTTAGFATKNGRVYLAGGQDPTGAPIATVQTAPMLSNGTLGAFAAAPSLMAARAGTQAQIVGNNFYVFGGDVGTTVTGPSPTGSVERAPIAANGTLGTFVSGGVALGTPRMYFTSTATAQYVYVLGGFTDAALTTVTNSVERAPILANGTLGAFAPAGVSLVKGRADLFAFATSSYVYVLGGNDVTNNLDTVERAFINADGTLGSFSDAGIKLPTPLDGMVANLIGNSLYVIGGGYNAVDMGGVMYPTNVLVSTVTGGVLGPFTNAIGVSLRAGRAGQASVVVGSSLYELGGANTTLATQILGSIERAPLQ
jgi:hypothetical protein